METPEEFKNITDVRTWAINRRIPVFHTCEGMIYNDSGLPVLQPYEADSGSSWWIMLYYETREQLFRNLPHQN